MLKIAGEQARVHARRWEAEARQMARTNEELGLEVEALEEELAGEEEAHQRDPKRLRRVLARAKQLKRRTRLIMEIAKGFRNWLFNSERWRKERYYGLMDKWHDAQGWSAAWKAAAKKWRPIAFTMHRANGVLRAERDELQQRLERAYQQITLLDEERVAALTGGEGE